MKHCLTALLVLLVVPGADLLQAATTPVNGSGLELAGSNGTASDLELQEIGVTEGTYVQGDNISIFTDIENIGSETSDVSSLDYYASTDTDIGPDDIHLGDQVTLPALEAGKSFVFVSSRTIPADLPSGDYYIGGILTVVDADDTNHVNFDAIAITVNNDPDIRIRPLSLNFREEASYQAVSQVAPEAAMKSARQHTESIFPSLSRAADKRGFVRVIVGLESAYQSHSIQRGNDQKVRRKGILDTGNQLVASLRNHTFKLKHQYETIPFMAMTVDTGALEALRASPLVRSINEDSLDRPFMASSNPVIGSPIAWAEGYDGSGWAVAVLDTGVESGHSWFSTGGGKIVSEACYSSNETDVSESLCPGGAESSVAENSGLNCESETAGCDHGTHVAGTVAGNDGSGPDSGVAPGADIIAIQVFSKFLTDEDCRPSRAPCLLSTDSDQIAAMERVLLLSEGMNIAAVNMSLGGDLYSDQASCDADNPGKKAAIQNLRDAGIATVIAAGNNRSTDSIASPACISNAISVGASDDQDDVASFSNIYPQLHLLAPGVGITSSIPPDRVGSKQGTSMAAPHVAGAWAVMKQRAPLATVDEVLDAFTNTATQLADQRLSVSAASGLPEGDPAEPVPTYARINLDMALGEPRTSFGIFNTGPVALNVVSIIPEVEASWISLVPEPPFDIETSGLQVVSVVVDYESAPAGDSQLRLLVNSDDPDENPYPDGVFVNIQKLTGSAPEFESTPAPFSVIDFGSVYPTHTSTQKTVSVENRGTSDLTVSCSKSGTNGADFTIDTCETVISPGSNSIISLFCAPSVAGIKTAGLHLTTNDANETEVSYRLYCVGMEFPTGDEIFKDDFESD